MRDQTTNTLAAITNAAPPAAVTFANTVLQMPVEKWLTVVLIIYTVLQTAVLIRDRVVKNRRATDKRGGDET